MTFFVFTQSYCGMTLPHGEFDSITAARDRLNKRLRWLEKQDAVPEQLDPYTWEIPDDGQYMLVPDFCGVLQIRQNMNIR